jgi:glycosyltransferase 2 family protein
VVLLVLPSPVPVVLALAATLALVVLVLAFLALARLPHGWRRNGLRSGPHSGLPSSLGSGPSRWARVVRAAGSDLRDGVLARRAWPGIVAASVVVVAGHAATFLIAARATGVTASPDRLLPLALLILLAMAVPANIGGWGPREGVAAWAFGAAGLGAAQGLATAVGYGVLVLVANLPGALVLLAARPGRGKPPPEHEPPEQETARPLVASRERAAHG